MQLEEATLRLSAYTADVRVPVEARRQVRGSLGPGQQDTSRGLHVVAWVWL